MEVTLTDILRPWLEFHYSNSVWIDQGNDKNFASIRGHSPVTEPYFESPVTFAGIQNNVPVHVRTYRSNRSKTRQWNREGLLVFNWTPDYKTLYPSDPNFLKDLKHELDLIKAHGW